jgi:HEAT repeat protein
LTDDLAGLVERAAASTDERELAELRAVAEEEVDASVRSNDFRARALGYRALGVLDFRQKTELLGIGLVDPSPACRGAALISLELLSRDHPREVNAVRPLLHTIVNADDNAAVRRLALFCLKNGSPSRDTLVLLDHLTSDDEDAEISALAGRVVSDLKKRAREAENRGSKPRKIR